MFYSEMFPPSKERPKPQYARIPKGQMLANIISISFTNTTLLAFGAALQASAVLLPIPKYLALAPAILYLLSRALTTTFITFGLMKNPYLKGAIPYKYTALVPDENGNFPPADKPPTNERVAVLLLCAKINHPLGWFGAPEVKAFGALGQRMNDELATRPQSETGFLGQTMSFVPTESGITEVVNISYWRSAAHIAKYAESPTHREAIRWWADVGGNDSDGGKVAHIGIMHEIYESGPGQWESIYAGYQPSLLGATSYLRPGGKNENGNTIPDEWISPIIEARRGKLARHRGRMGLDLSSRQAETKV